MPVVYPDYEYWLRHVQSVGNRAQELARKGDTSAFTSEFRSFPGSLYPPTGLGVRQGGFAGASIRDFLEVDLELLVSSSYRRALFTAVALGFDLPIHVSTELREREDPSAEATPICHFPRLYPDEAHRLKLDPFHARPPGNSESYAELWQRMRSYFDWLAQKGAKSALHVCHGDVMRVIRFMRHGLTPLEIRELYAFDNHPLRQIDNCQLDCYSRIDPVSAKRTNRYRWFRTVKLGQEIAEPSDWKQIDAAPALLNEGTESGPLVDKPSLTISRVKALLETLPNIEVN